jgi:hypothetical protein
MRDFRAVQTVCHEEWELVEENILLSVSSCSSPPLPAKQRLGEHDPAAIHTKQQKNWKAISFQKILFRFG